MEKRSGADSAGTLPIFLLKEEIKEAIRQHQVVIVCGETGSGKTTQLPQICLELGRGMIGHTQPRRVAARTVASRIAWELRSEVGRKVGFKVRFHDKTGPDCAVKLMTDGILLAETQQDPDLSAYDTLIIDEAHERSLNIDFLLGFLKKLLPNRPDLKLIITSATIDAERFSHHFSKAPVIQVSGRTYPIEIIYRPQEEESDLEQSVLDAVGEGSRGNGDILVFLPGEREIRNVAEALRKHHPPETEILPLYARLSASEQEKVFRISNKKRIILSTNVAETSLTVPNIGVVIDTGLARVKRYSYRNKVEQLLVEKISRSSANQRSGRSGRVMAGTAIRLYSEEDFNSRPEFTDPEILRSSLAAVILRMKNLSLGEIENFPFIDRPFPKMVSDGYQLLSELGAVDENRNLTVLGTRLAKLPIDPKIARMILAAREENCLHEILIIASALSIRDPRERPSEKQEAADMAHQAFSHQKSEFMGFLKLWDFFKTESEKLSGRKLQEKCRTHFLSLQRLREWRDLHGQLSVIASEIGMKSNQVPAKYEEIHRSLLCGFLGNIGFKSEEDGQYSGARGIKFRIFPGSKLKRKPKWIMAGDITETSRLYARTVAEIDPLWIEKAGTHLLKRSYFEPHWEKKRAQVVAYEQLMLYGLIINPRKKIHYGPINPKEAREIFIREALVEEEYETSSAFFEHNLQLIREVEEIEHKSRRADVLVDDQILFEFYDSLIPADIHNGASFERWLRENPKKLFLSREYLMKHQAKNVTYNLFPDALQVSDLALSLKYRFEPGHVMDGVTAIIPLHSINKLEAETFDWLVPGLLREKITFLIKSLPKQLRSKLVPVPKHVDMCLDEMTSVGRRLTAELSAAIKKTTGLHIPVNQWNVDSLPLHLKMNYKIINEQGDEIAMGRDLAMLQNNFGKEAELDFCREHEFTRKNIIRWDFGDLPEYVEFHRNDSIIKGYYAIIDEINSVSLILLDTKEKAAEKTIHGLTRLFKFELKAQLKDIEKTLAKNLQTLYLPPGDDIRESFLNFLIFEACLKQGPITKESEFKSRLLAAKPQISSLFLEISRLLFAILQEFGGIRQTLAAPPLPFQKEAFSDIKIQLDHLVYPGFLEETGLERLKHFPRYLKAIQLRIAKLPNARDSGLSHEISRRFSAYLEKRGEKDFGEYRWMIEELRVSLFAQELRTPIPISLKRLDKYWEEHAS